MYSHLKTTTRFASFFRFHKVIIGYRCKLLYMTAESLNQKPTYVSLNWRANPDLIFDSGLEFTYNGMHHCFLYSSLQVFSQRRYLHIAFKSFFCRASVQFLQIFGYLNKFVQIIEHTNPPSAFVNIM